MRTRGWIAAVLVGATSVAVALSWPVPVPAEPPAPVREDQQDALYQESLRQQWAGWVGNLYPDAERPEIEAIEMLPDQERNAALGGCLEEVGFTVIDYASGISYSPPADGNEEALAVGQFVCEARYPDPGQLDSLMTVEQRSALYDYYVGFLPTCLAVSGFPVATDPPSREEFVETSVQWPTWSPYQAVWESGATDAEYTGLERRCPSDPAWRRQVAPVLTVGG